MVSILILGLGWTGQFLVELLSSESQYTYAATTRDGRDGTIPWLLSQDPTTVDISSLPPAETVLVMFPVKSAEIMESLVRSYNSRHGAVQWILLSSTRPFSHPGRNDRHSPLDPSKDTGRMAAEYKLIELKGTVLHLAGLWGAQRQPKNWVGRFTSEDALKSKILIRQLHLIHGKDVARSILATHIGYGKSHAGGQRWIVTDGGCYDWLVLFSKWASSEQMASIQHLLAHDDDVQKKWQKNQTLQSLIEKGGIEPRLDSREFWENFGLEPIEFLSL